MKFLEAPTRHLMFTGKGGVGKTSLACSTAISLADAGARVLLVSTDPASNLDEVLETRLGPTPTPVESVPGLQAMNIDPEAAARAYRDRQVGAYRDVLPDAAIASIEEQLSGACTTEIATFDKFSKLLGEAAATAEFDHVLFDTAPTGHTLRLLELPAAWSGFLDASSAGTSCLGPLSGLQAQRQLYAATVLALCDGAVTTVILVSRPERSALDEAERTRGELAGLGVTNLHLVVNGVLEGANPGDEFAMALESQGRTALAHIPVRLASLPSSRVPLQALDLVGVPALRDLFAPIAAARTEPVLAEPAGDLPPSLASMIPGLARHGRGVIMTMGKGGVGKTTIASAIAVELARLGHQVHLSTTDPAAHLDASLARTVPGLEVSRIDSGAETRAYRAEVMAASSNLDAAGRDLLEEDLRSPCTEELAVFRAFARKVALGLDGFVVLDTAPTGHTLLLLDATEAYHRQVSHTMSELPEAIRELLPRLRDPEFTRILVVTLAEATPVHEAAGLQRELLRAGIRPYGWVLNQTLLLLKLTDPRLRGRQGHQLEHVREVLREHTDNAVLVPWMRTEPVGTEGLQAMLRRGHGELATGAPAGLARSQAVGPSATVSERADLPLPKAFEPREDSGASS